MVAQSGVFPYDLIEPQPVVSPSSVGFTAIGFTPLFEQALWVTLAEWRRYGFIGSGEQDVFRFRNYHNVSGQSVLGLPYPSIYSKDVDRYAFEPDASGANLSTSGNIAAVDWINDLRFALSGITNDHLANSVWGWVKADSDLPLVDPDNATDQEDETVHFSQIWLRALGETVGAQNSPETHTAALTQRHFVHGIPTGVGQITDASYVGVSGSIFDVDLREVSYHPIPRFTKLFINRVHVFNNPIFPCFAHPNGSLIQTNSFEDSFVASGHISNDFNLAHVQSGFIRVDGDMLLDDFDAVYQFGDKFGSGVVLGKRKFYNGLTDFDEPSNFSDHYAELNPSGETLYSVNRAFVIPPTGNDLDVVEIRVSNSGCPVPSSLDVSLFPFRNTDSYVGDSLNPFNYDMENQLPASGFQYFTDALWTVMRSPRRWISDINANKHSGLLLIPPSGLSFMWIRLDPIIHQEFSSSEAADAISNAGSVARVGNEIWHRGNEVRSNPFQRGDVRVLQRDLRLNDSPTVVTLPPTEVENEPSGNGTTDFAAIGYIYDQKIWLEGDRDIGGEVLIERPIINNDTSNTAYNIPGTRTFGVFFETNGEGIGLGTTILDGSTLEGNAVISGFVPNVDTTDPVQESVIWSDPTFDLIDNTGHGYVSIDIDNARTITGATSYNDGLWAVGSISRTVSNPFSGRQKFLGRITISINSTGGTDITLEEIHPISFVNIYGDFDFEYLDLMRIGLLET